MFSTPQVTDHTDFSFYRVEKKVKPHVVSCLTSPLTKNKQEHPKRQKILFHSCLGSLHYSLGQVSMLSSHSMPLHLPAQDKSLPMRGAYEDRLKAGPSVTACSTHDRAMMMFLLAVCNHSEQRDKIRFLVLKLANSH